VPLAGDPAARRHPRRERRRRWSSATTAVSEPVNAIGAIDERLDGWIALAVKRGMIGGLHGELFHVPTRGRIAADAVLIAGMGVPGSFNEDRLRSLMANVALGTGALGMTAVATVLVGAGEGSLDPERRCAR